MCGETLESHGGALMSVVPNVIFYAGADRFPQMNLLVCGFLAVSGSPSLVARITH